MPIEPTWMPHGLRGELNCEERDQLPVSVFAFPKQRKEALTDASHIKNALARFNQVGPATDEERDLAFANIKKAAKHFSVRISQTDWRNIDKKSVTKKPLPVEAP